MAILNQILSNRQAPFGFTPLQVTHPNFMVPQAPESAGMDPQDPGRTLNNETATPFAGRGGGFDPSQLGSRAQDWLAQLQANGMDLGSVLNHQARGRHNAMSPPPSAAGGAPAPQMNPYGSGIMGSVMKAFNGGGAGGLDPAKLMSMLAAG